MVKTPAIIRRERARRFALAVLLAAVVPTAPATLTAAPRQDEPVVLSGTIGTVTRGRAEEPTIVVIGRSRVVIPPDMKIEFPAASMTVDEAFQQAPAGCRLRGESGLATADQCRTDPEGTEAAAARGPAHSTDSASPASPASPEAAPEPPLETELAAARAKIEAAKAADGTLVAMRVRITTNIEQQMGGVTFINAADGYVRINGWYRQDTGGTLVRINDPTRQQSDQHGAGCGSGPNCSPDARFRVDSVAFSVRFERGNPACIGGDAQGCFASNRKIPDDDTVSPVPIRVGDNLVAAGAFETVRGERFFSAQSLQVQAVLTGER